MSSYIKFLILAFFILGPLIDVFAKQKRGVGNLISKLRNNREKGKLKDEYDPRAHLYAQFLNSSFANMTLSNGTEEISPVFQQQEVIHGKGILEIFKPRTTIDPKEKLFMLYLRALNANMTLSTTAGTKSVTQANEEQIGLLEITCSIKPNIDNVQNHLMSENGCITTLKENVYEQEVETTPMPCDANNVAISTTYEEVEEETTSVGWDAENIVITESEKGYVTQENEPFLREENTEKEWYPNDIKYLFPDQI